VDEYLLWTVSEGGEALAPLMHEALADMV